MTSTADGGYSNFAAAAAAMANKQGSTIAHDGTSSLNYLAKPNSNTQLRRQDDLSKTASFH